jgi:ATP-dependent Lon protease
MPLFPLPNAVLFPGGLLPLHIFEPRYVAMTRHSLATHRTIAVVLTLPGDPDEQGNPPIVTACGAGVIVDHTELPDGRLNIVLRGEARVLLHELPFVPPFRRARAEILADEGGPPDPGDLTALLAVATAFATDVRAQNPSFDFNIPSSLPPERTPDVVAHYLVVDARVRQDLMLERNVRLRTQKTIEALATQRELIKPHERGISN